MTSSTDRCHRSHRQHRPRAGNPCLGILVSAIQHHVLYAAVLPGLRLPSQGSVASSTDRCHHNYCSGKTWSTCSHHWPAHGSCCLKRPSHDSPALRPHGPCHTRQKRQLRADVVRNMPCRRLRHFRLPTGREAQPSACPFQRVWRSSVSRWGASNTSRFRGTPVVRRGGETTQCFRTSAALLFAPLVVPLLSLSLATTDVPSAVPVMSSMSASTMSQSAGPSLASTETQGTRVWGRPCHNKDVRQTNVLARPVRTNLDRQNGVSVDAVFSWYHKMGHRWAATKHRVNLTTC